MMNEGSPHGEILSPDRRALDRRKVAWITRHSVSRDDGGFSVDSVRTHREGRYGGHAIAGLDVSNSWSDGVHDPGGFQADPRGKGRRFQVCALAKHRLRAVQADRLDFDSNLIVNGFGHRQILDAQNVCGTGLMKANNLRHTSSDSRTASGDSQETASAASTITRAT